MRSLFLHVSALNDDEYTLFTSSFADLVASDPPLKPDDDFEKLTVSIREARAWLRGRYPDLPVSDLDQVRLSLSLSRPHLTPFSPPRARSCVSSRQVRDMTRPLAGASFSPFFVLSYMFAAEQS
jgi:hypothetical protein